MKRSTHEVTIASGTDALYADLVIPESAAGLVIFAHGSGSSRFSSRNRFVAEVLQQRHLATLLLDLLTTEEAAIDERTREFRFDIPLLARRVVTAMGWAKEDSRTLPVAKRIGLFGASTGAAAALIAAAECPHDVQAIVSRGGRPDLAGDALHRVKAPTLLIVGADDDACIPLNQSAYRELRCEKKLEFVPGATHLFEEPGTLQRAAGLAADWLARYLKG